jgi:hypothetical protein
MKHHLVIYGPMQDQRSTEYKDATTESVSLGNIGLEWLIPSALLLASAVTAFHFLHVRLAFRFVAIGDEPAVGLLDVQLSARRDALRGVLDGEESLAAALVYVCAKSA